MATHVKTIFRRKNPRKPKWCRRFLETSREKCLLSYDQEKYRLHSLVERQKLKGKCIVKLVLAVTVFVLGLGITQDDVLISQRLSQRQCQHQARDLSVALLRAEYALRNMQTTRRRSLVINVGVLDRAVAPCQLSGACKIDVRKTGSVVACGVTARAGAATVVWSTHAALWGVLPVPLYRTAVAPRVLLQPTKPLPADCWPFRGSRGEVIIELAHLTRVSLLSIEHVRPDSTRSAPASFTILGILSNGTRTAGHGGEYRGSGPARQMFRTGLATLVNAVGLRMHSNQGNPRYTCLYRVQVYTHVD